MRAPRGKKIFIAHSVNGGGNFFQLCGVLTEEGEI
nr:MAG TPA: hypothetical protein [Caudoviricetes sp.]